MPQAASSSQRRSSSGASATNRVVFRLRQSIRLRQQRRIGGQRFDRSRQLPQISRRTTERLQRIGTRSMQSTCKRAYRAAARSHTATSAMSSSFRPRHAVHQQPPTIRLGRDDARHHVRKVLRQKRAMSLASIAAARRQRLEVPVAALSCESAARSTSPTCEAARSRSALRARQRAAHSRSTRMLRRTSRGCVHSRPSTIVRMRDHQAAARALSRSAGSSSVATSIRDHCNSCDRASLEQFEFVHPIDDAVARIRIRMVEAAQHDRTQSETVARRAR